MTAVTWIAPDGSARSLVLKDGDTLMEGALAAGARGIEAECGGSLSCGTCHVYVDPAHSQRLPPPAADEAEVLEGVAAERRVNSRLSCQVTVGPELDGAVVQAPDRQF